MTVRRVELRLLTPSELLIAAERILDNPSCNVQRVSMDEVYTFAIATTHFAEICGLVARVAYRQATPAEGARLRAHLVALDFLPADAGAPTTAEETQHG